MEWNVLNIIAIIAFSFSGAIVALQEKYDVFGVYILGLTASFGGGIIRNLLIGVPIKPIWEQGILLQTALVAITVIYFLPRKWITSWNRWNDFFDAIGLSAFTIQGAIFAIQLNLPLGGIILSSVITGIGGGIIRDVLAGRKPILFSQEIYAVWALIVGLILGEGWIQTDNSGQLFVLFVVISVLRILSIIYKWHLRLRNLDSDSDTQSVNNWKKIFTSLH
ncbi:trimeric intracellular cation channel family protein [Aneurinibacillus sp. Ricciae_BoGa-3]|uniref:trimeric intracellular cation channel family protein n=1 Tax=Aneurinibacillus sp. Ricciae_BoGa-3 TaxID=3022697 RepID=UPI0023423044|nr:trimeric intracellular cation channel family protein [Aneurinibacillus sp. Ricciae_BoGa-3]WCK54139.1 trimeric intracellular cation channel family protein [Aneurinibacillus sp. Ricciae_BoGa-3]